MKFLSLFKRKKKTNYNVLVSTYGINEKDRFPKLIFSDMERVKEFMKYIKMDCDKIVQANVETLYDKNAIEFSFLKGGYIQRSYIAEKIIKM